MSEEGPLVRHRLGATALVLYQLLAVTTATAATTAALSTRLAATTLATTGLCSAFVALTAGLFAASFIFVSLVSFCHALPPC